MTPQEQAQAEINSILNDKGHAMYERFHRSDPAAIEHMNRLWEQTSVPEPTPPPQAPQPEPPKTPAAENWSSPPSESLSATEQAEFDAEKVRGEGELRNRWGNQYDSNLGDMIEMRDAFWNPHSADDTEVRDLIAGAVGNDPRFIVRLQQLKGEVLERLKSSPAADTSGMTRAEQESKVIAFAQFALGNLKSPVSQAILDAVGDDPKVFNWALKNAVKIFGR